ncbi:hypothetical protein Y032_0017g3358 [Ancylostoma ceylanicum]|uniref:Uncharacterized protein n=1 Tax=Ancylostoma ceylanicum TaxID=53326 RepID=A0A016V5C2_9BILA|nr:hypothetical protein Y032_0017g3358 [Ancylostoma ceylanicum]
MVRVRAGAPCRHSLVLETPGYASAPSTAENTEIRDHQWRRAVLAGSSVKNAKDMRPPIQKGASAPELWKTQGCGSTDGERIYKYQPDRPANAGLPGFFSCSLRSRCLYMTSFSRHADHPIFVKTPASRNLMRCGS